MLRSTVRLLAALVVLLCLANGASAQVPSVGKAAAVKVAPSGPTVGRVDAITSGTIAVVKSRGGESITFQLDKGVEVISSKPIKRDEITGEKWATVSGRPSKDNPDVLQASRVSIAAKTPEKPEPTSAPGMAVGMLTLEGDKASLKVGEKTLTIALSERTRFSSEMPAKLDAIKVGGMVSVSGKEVNGKLTAAKISILPSMASGPRPVRAGEKGKGRPQPKKSE
jgi:hypothetical protein